MARTFYRIVRSNPPSLTDFLSDAARGKPAPSRLETRKLHSGLSVFRTQGQARRKAQAFPALGDFIAELRVPDGAPIEIERTIPRSPGHHTLWASPEKLLDCVVAVDPV